MSDTKFLIFFFLPVLKGASPDTFTFSKWARWMFAELHSNAKKYWEDNGTYPPAADTLVGKIPLP